MTNQPIDYRPILPIKVEDVDLAIFEVIPRLEELRVWIIGNPCSDLVETASATHTDLDLDVAQHSVTTYSALGVESEH